jgi:hypothetical protein
LYYRLQVVPVFVSPLRKRTADIPVLARYFLRDLTRRGEPPVLAPDALSALLGYAFPGNVRELKTSSSGRWRSLPISRFCGPNTCACPIEGACPRRRLETMAAEGGGSCQRPGAGRCPRRT